MDQNGSSRSSTVPLVPQFPFETSLEYRFESLGFGDYIQRNYHHSLYYVVAYLLVIPAAKSYMSCRPPLKLRWSLVAWNAALSVISLAGALRTVPELVHSLRYFGLEHTICDDRYYYVSEVMACWCHIIVMSKVLELLDTVFIVLRKRKVIFLHWFHHSSVLLFTWVTAKDKCAVTRWYMSMNYTIHAVMYGYYAARALGFRVPKPLAISITAAQILQMVVGFLVSLLGLRSWYLGRPCALSGRVAIFGTALYTFYFVLFVHFFATSYVLPRLHKLEKAN